MESNEEMKSLRVTYDTLPAAITWIIDELQEIRVMLASVQPPAPGRRPILIDDACRLLGKAKQTVYALACRGEIPNYKQGRTVYFFEDELLEWIASGKVKTNEELRKEAERALYKGTRR